MNYIREANHHTATRRLRRGQAALGAIQGIVWATGAAITLAVAHGLVEAAATLGWDWGTIAWVALLTVALLGAGIGYLDDPRRR